MYVIELERVFEVRDDSNVSKYIGDRSNDKELIVVVSEEDIFDMSYTKFRGQMIDKLLIPKKYKDNLEATTFFSYAKPCLVNGVDSIKYY